MPLTASSRATVRQDNRRKRDARIRTAFRTRYTSQPLPRKHAREYVIAKLADEFFLSVDTIEAIIYSPDPSCLPPTPTPTAPTAASR